MPGPEAKIERDVCRDAYNFYGIENIKMKNLGWPDRMFLIPNHPFWVEFKAPGAAPSTIQSYTIKRTKRLNYDVEIHDSYETALQAIVDRIKKEKHGL